ncbi:MAG: hypothetical protein IPO05_12470 [Flavobacteriales bacterium]|jgi:hypothetical protein|nr:hypothetical protein [Flavobacteriales bacterium]MBK9514403.1 hypothetical protein [Flavobacteriales bacterium]MBP7450595.1 hypothetical protein [Flavobacteriales bacterium]HOZ41117.1 hypothetical protein [Flavobacteriales bacterium]
MALHAPHLSYYRTILDKISWADRATFRKELRKAFRRCSEEERTELKNWFRNTCVCRNAAPSSGDAGPDQLK